MVYNVEIPPPQDGILLLLAEQPPQQPPPANQFNNPGVDRNDGNDPNDGNNGVEQAEDVLIFSPFLINVVDPPQLMVPESPILPFQPQLPEVCNYNYSTLIELCTLQAIFYAENFITLQGVHISDPEETGTEDGEQSESPSSDIFENFDDQVEYMELR